MLMVPLTEIKSLHESRPRVVFAGRSQLLMLMLFAAKRTFEIRLLWPSFHYIPGRDISKKSVLLITVDILNPLFVSDSEK